MSETLFSATLAIARMIPGNVVVDGVATSDGNANKLTLVDNAAWFVSPTTLPAEDYFNGGTIWFRDLTTAADETKAYIITDYATATGTYTYTPALTVKTVTGDIYSATNRLYPRFILRQAVNAALADIDGEDLQNATLTTVSDQMTYDLPSGVYNVHRVEVARNSSTPYDYKVIDRGKWREINDDIAMAEGYQFTTTGDLIRLTYRVPFAELTTDSGTLPDLVSMNWVKWFGVAYCLRWKLGLTDGDEKVQTFLQEALVNAEKMAMRYRPRMQQMPMDPAHSVWAVPSPRSATNDVGEPGTVTI